MSFDRYNLTTLPGKMSNTLIVGPYLFLLALALLLHLVYVCFRSIEMVHAWYFYSIASFPDLHFFYHFSRDLVCIFHQKLELYCMEQSPRNSYSLPREALDIGSTVDAVASLHPYTCKQCTLHHFFYQVNSLPHISLNMWCLVIYCNTYMAGSNSL